jgi:hypothetical protein
MSSRQHYVCALGRERKMVLNEHLHIAESGLKQVLGKDRQAPLP